MKATKNRTVGLSLSYTYFILNTIISIFISSFIIRTVGKTDYGVYQSMTAFLSYLVLLEFGAGTIMNRNISLLKKDGSDEDKIKSNVSTIWSLTVILALFIAIVAFVFWTLIGSIYSNSMTSAQIKLGKQVFVFAAINTLCSFLIQTLHGILIGFEYYTFEKALSIIKLLVRTALVVVILSWKSDVRLLVALDCLLTITVFTITLLFCVIKLKAKLVFRYFDKSVFKSSLPLALAMLLQTVVNTANGSVDKFCISIMMKPEDVSIYSISMTMFQMFSSVATLPITMFMPQIAKNVRDGKKGRELTEALIQPCRLNVLITGALMFGLLVIGRQFIRIIYGVEFVESWIYAMVVIIPMFFNMSNGVITNVIDIYNKRHIRSFILMGTTALNIFITIFGIKYYGMIGAAVGTAISLIGQIITLNIFYSKKIDINVMYLFKESFKGILPYLVVSALGAFGITCLFKNVYLQFFIGGFSFLVIFAILFLLFGTNEFEKSYVQKILIKLHIKKNV